MSECVHKREFIVYSYANVGTASFLWHWKSVHSHVSPIWQLYVGQLQVYTSNGSNWLYYQPIPQIVTYPRRMRTICIVNTRFRVSYWMHFISNIHVNIH